MDLLYQRYASPFSFLDGIIQSGRFYDFVVYFDRTIAKEKEEKTLWEYYLHRVYDKSFEAWKEEMRNDLKNKNMSERTIETTVQDSVNILNNFNPEERG